MIFIIMHHLSSVNMFWNLVWNCCGENWCFYQFVIIIFLILASASYIFEQFVGLLSISSQLLPSIMNLLKRLTEEAHVYTNPQPTIPASSHSFRSQTLQSNPDTNTILDPSAATIVESAESSNVHSCSDDEIEYSSPNVAHQKPPKIWLVLMIGPDGSIDVCRYKNSFGMGSVVKLEAVNVIKQHDLRTCIVIRILCPVQNIYVYTNASGYVSHNRYTYTMF